MKIRVSIERDADPDEWDAALDGLGGSLFHSSAWARYRAVAQRDEPVYFRWYDSSDVLVALALGLRRPGYGSVAGRVCARLDFPSPPATTDQFAVLPPLLRVLERDSALVDVRLGSFDAAGRQARWGEVLPAQSSRYEFVIPSAPAPEALKRMRKGTRGAIRVAEKSGVVVTSASSAEDVHAFCRLYESTLERLRDKKDVSVAPVPASFAEAIRGLLASGAGRLYVARADGELVGASLFGLYGRSAYYLLNGSDSRALKLGAVPAILLHAFDEFAEQGVPQVNLGGAAGGSATPGAPDNGLYEFKVGLGAEPVLCTSGRITPRSPRARALRGLLAGRAALLSGRSQLGKRLANA